MLVYHLGVAQFADQLTGEGAKLYGGRWNLVGHPCIYAGETKALCALEYAANVLLEDMPENLAFTTYEIPNDNLVSFGADQLPFGWQNTPPSKATQIWGSETLNGKLAIRVPSVIIPSEFNFVLNPLHPDFKKVKVKAVESFTFDPRIKK